jgi:hypothetical protein
MKNKKFYLMNVFLVLILFFGICFVSSEEPNWPGKDLGYPEGLITGPVGFETIAVDTHQLTVTGQGPIRIGGKLFEGVIPGKDSVFIIDPKGNIMEANFRSEGGFYGFGNTMIKAPPNSRVIFDEKSGIAMAIPDGAETENPNIGNYMGVPNDYPILFEGNEEGVSFKLKVDGQPYDIKGKVHWENGNYYVDFRDTTTINGIEVTKLISPKDMYNIDSIDVYFDGDSVKDHYGDHIAFSKEGFRLKSESSFAVATLKPGNSYVNFRKEGSDYFAGTAFDGGAIEVQKRVGYPVPSATCRGLCTFGTGPKTISSFNRPIPSMPGHDSSGSPIKLIDNDVRVFQGQWLVDREMTYLGGSGIGSTTPPMEFSFQDRSGNNLFEKDNRLFVDYSGEYTVQPPLQASPPSQTEMEFDFGEPARAVRSNAVKARPRVRYNNQAVAQSIAEIKLRKLLQSPPAEAQKIAK